VLKIVDKLSIPLFAAVLCIAYVWSTFSMDWIVIRYPYAIISIIAVLWCSIVFDEVKSIKNETSEINCKESVDPGKFGMLTVSTLLYLAAATILGYFTATLIFVSFLMYQLGNRNIRQVAFIAVVFVGLQYLFFNVLLNLPIPEGFLF